jgi:hypothetical protein
MPVHDRFGWREFGEGLPTDEERRAAMENIVREVQRRKIMAVRAKVRCNAKTGNEVHFTTVYEPDGTKNDENSRFTKATPWGDIRMGIDNPTAMEQFEINKEYYVDFTPAS